MEDILKIGVAVKPQGVKGEIKVQPITQDLKRFLSLKETIIDGVIYKVIKSRIDGNAAFIVLSGVNDRNSAELFRGKFLCVKREDAIPLDEYSFFIEDIIGISVEFDGGEKLGKVTDATNAKTDYLTVNTESGKTVRFPFLKRIIKSVDIKGGKMILIKENFLQVACYED